MKIDELLEIGFIQTFEANVLEKRKRFVFPFLRVFQEEFKQPIFALDFQIGGLENLQHY
jgi:hypothetical protein